MMQSNPYSISFDSFVYYGILIYLSSLVFEGPIRLLLHLYGVSYLIYIRDIFVIIVLLIYFLQSWLNNKINRLFLVIVGIFIFHSIVALFYVGNIAMSLFAWKIYLLLFIGILYGHLFFSRLQVSTRIFFILLICASVGIIINYYVEFPWEGLEYSLGGLDIEAVRSWSTFGIKRLSGFARTSYDAASQILLLALFIVCFLRNALSKTLLWLVIFPPILLTTSKGIIITYLLLTTFFVAYQIIPNYFKIYNKLLFVVLLIVIILPLISYFSSIYTDVPAYLESFFMRVFGDWPDAFRLVQQHGNVLLGRGLGGMGTSQLYFEVQKYNPGDNIFLIFYGNLGLFGVGYLFYLTLIGQSLDLRKELFYYLFIFSFLTYGIVTSCIENGLFCLFLGVFLGYANNRKLRAGNSNDAYCMT